MPDLAYKACTKCGDIKPLTDFYRQGGKKLDGHMNACKVCDNKRKRRWDREHLGHLKAQYWARRDRSREKIRARVAVNNRVMRGQIVKPDHCECCGTPASGRDLQAHHHDYSEPLDIEWLCRSCHRRRHLEAEQAATDQEAGETGTPQNGCSSEVHRISNS